MIPADTAMSHAEIVRRLDQSLVDFKSFVDQRLTDQNILYSSWRESDQRLLDERFKTQTTTLDAAFAAAEKARREALATANETAARTDARIKAVEDSVGAAGAHARGLSDAWGYVVGATGILFAVVTVVLSVAR